MQGLVFSFFFKIIVTNQEVKRIEQLQYKPTTEPTLKLGKGSLKGI